MTSRHRAVRRMLIPIGLLAALAAAVLLARAPVGRASGCGATVEWVGGHGQLWTTAENWGGGKTPTEAQTACIPSGQGTIVVPKGPPVATAKTLAAQSPLEIQTGGTLKLAANAGFAESSEVHEIMIREGAELQTVDGPVKVLGNAVDDGQITGEGAIGDEVVFKDAGGVFSGTGSIGPTFAALEGTLAPGGIGTVGSLTFLHHFDNTNENFKIAIDIASAVSFDELIAEGGDEPSFVARVEPVLIGGYQPPAGTKWRFLQSKACVICGQAEKPWAVTTLGEGGAASVELLEVPPVGPQPPLLEVKALNTQAEFVATPTELGTGALQEYVFHIEPGGRSEKSYSATALLTGFTNCLTYTATAQVRTTVGTSGASAPVSFTPQGPEGCGPGKGSGQTGAGGGSSPGGGGSGATGGAGEVASTPKAVEEVLLGCSKRQLVLNDVVIRGSRVLLDGSAAKSLAGKKVKILFDDRKQVATATVGADGRFSASAPLPAARLRNSNSARYSAVQGSQRSLNLKLTRRLVLNPPTASGDTVTLTGQVTPPLTRPAAPITVYQQLACGKQTVAAHVTPPANGRFKITVNVPAGAKAAVYRLQSAVAEKPGAKHGFPTYSLPLPVAIG